MTRKEKQLMKSRLIMITHYEHVKQKKSPFKTVKELCEFFGMPRKTLLNANFNKFFHFDIAISRTGILACHLIVRQECLTYRYSPKGKELYKIGIILIIKVQKESPVAELPAPEVSL